MFMDMNLAKFDEDMRLNYFGAVYTAKEAANQMVVNKIKGKIVFTSSVLGLFGLVGYSPYVPSKFAIRGKVLND
jgi:3-dehydrosphinganine reductase